MTDEKTLQARRRLTNAIQKAHAAREKQKELQKGRKNAPKKSGPAAYERRLEALKEAGRLDEWHALVP